MKYTVSRTTSGKWLLYSKGKLIKPYDYVPSDYATLLTHPPEGKHEIGSENVERISQPHHSSGHDSSQYTFAHVGIQAVMSETLPKGAGDMTGHHGWQPVLMTGLMWMANVVGEYMTKLGYRPGMPYSGLWNQRFPEKGSKRRSGEFPGVITGIICLVTPRGRPLLGSGGAL